MDNKFVELIVNELKEKIKPSIFELFDLPDGAARIAQRLPIEYTPTYIVENDNAMRAWELSGLYYYNLHRFYEALPIFLSQYEQINKAQLELNKRFHKGTPLCWISDCFNYLGCRWLAKKYIMLTLCEDAFTSENGIINLKKTGVYPRLTISFGLPESEFKRYAKEFHNLYSAETTNFRFFPEFFLQKIDDKWISEIVTPNEQNHYYINKQYATYLYNKLGEGDGQSLEILTSYLLGSIPGIRSKYRQKTKSSDLDVINIIEGNFGDYRNEVSRYFICECKDWESTIGSSIIRDFQSKILSKKTNFGILFSKKGITGNGKDTDAQNEIRTAYQGSGIVILDVSLPDLKLLIEGANLIVLLRGKYERLRLDLYKPLL